MQPVERLNCYRQTIARWTRLVSVSLDSIKA